ncbi:hypothetical protein AVEN_264250-1 [Araneus ventricosus]|uniref:Uncharacterized protein n=1 Tax=Araneus ventricosus TaxID=182803 RepID=A0A4Y2QZR1_ARAVE|nr:hypothetical protein AVEN_264250-1 [Araneus ventricosus]
MELFRAVPKLENLFDFYRPELKNVMVRDDYRELIELSIVFLGGDAEKNLKIRPPGTMHQARWMAQAIYSLKLSLFSSQLKLNTQDKEVLLDFCLFIVTIYVKPCLQFIFAAQAPYKRFELLEIFESLRKCE